MASAKGSEFAGTRRFHVLSRLGEGGMGVVYEAYDRDRATRVALKILTSVSADTLMRFKNEFRALADLHHPNLVSLGELVCHGDGAGAKWFFTMELVEGVDLLRYVRGASGDERLDAGGEGRLRLGLSGLAQGLSALHAAGKVHRDIKPSNILVTPQGRVVLLDFGLATDAMPRAQTSDAHAVGTVDYMAPEQAASKPVGPAADWYSVGVLLYEALTGHVPFVGAPLEILMNKQKFEPPPPRAVLPTVVADLDALCVELLRFEPDARPQAREILQRLGAGGRAMAMAPTPAVTFTRAPPFVGRRTELAALRKGYDDARGGHPVSILVEGESGVGKSLLTRHFVDALSATEERAVVLTGRCYERESVPYKAFDGVVDMLSRFMMKLPRVEASALLPLKASLLAQVFPVLRRVEVIAQAPLPRDQGVKMDPQEQRSRVFQALRELLARLAERRPLVVVIDDLQWADADSRAMLAEVLRPPDPPALLLIATVRDESGAPELELGQDVRRLRLGALTRDEACRLVELLWPGATAVAPTIVAETAGHPLFIDELVRHLQLAGDLDRHDSGMRLEDALRARISKLEPQVRRILELAAVAGAPVTHDLLSRAASCDPAELLRHLGLLRVAHLLRSSGGRGVDAVECYHDRVLAAVVSGLDAATKRTCHERLALALEAAPQTDAEALGLHWQGAGDCSKAARYAGDAAVQAAEALAFDRAVRLYRLALELSTEAGCDVETLRALRIGLGDALANIGRGREAGDVFLQAAEGASAAVGLSCRRRAADEYLRSGFTDEGMQALVAVLEVTGMRLAKTPARALMSWVYNRAKLRIRGYGFRERDASQVSLKELERIDTCWSASVGLGMVDNIRGADYQTRHLLLALKAGEPYRVCRALALEAAYAATYGRRGLPRTERLLATARELADKIDEPHGAGLVASASAIAAFLAGDWGRALILAQEAEVTLRDRCTGVSWELNTSQLFGLWALWHLGKMAELSRQVPERLREAQARGNRYAATNLRVGLISAAWLVGDDAPLARAHVDEAMKLWSREGFHLQHYYEILGHGMIDLYEGRGSDGYQRLMQRWRDLEKSLILRIRSVGLEAEAFRGRLALAAAAQAEGSARAALLKQAARQIKRASGELSAEPVARLLAAGVAAMRGDLDGARADLELADKLAGQRDMLMHQWVARWRRGRLLGGDEGAALVAAAEAAAHEEKVVRPDLFAAMLAPGFPG